MSLASPSQVKSIGALTYNLFNLADDPALTTFVQTALDDANNWLQVYLGTNYGGATAPETAIQTRAEVYLALSYLTPTLKAQKIYGTHYPLDSEDSAAYENLLEQDWEGLARSLLAKWISFEPTGAGAGAQNFALPYFAASDGPDLTDPFTTDSEDLRLRRIADRARGFPEVDFSTVSR